MDFNEFKNLIKKQFEEKLGTELSEKQIQQFYLFMNLLIEKNKVMNLTAITEPNEIIVRHFVDSSILLKVYEKDFLKNKNVIDVGTGAGFPGIPLAIMYQDTKFLLTDTLGKRISFLEEVVKNTNLKNVTLCKSRAEDLAHDKSYREKFDYILSRGVARISVLAEYSLPFVKVGGKMLAYKMDDCEQELREGENAIKLLGGLFHVKHSYSIIENEPNRCILEIDKIIPSPKTYPRKAGTPSKNPL